MNPLDVEIVERTAMRNRIINSMLMLNRLDVPIATTRITMKRGAGWIDGGGGKILFNRNLSSCLLALYLP